MHINTYTPRPIDEITHAIESWKASLSMLENLKARGFETINEAWRSIVKTQVTKRELDKFAKLLGEGIEARKDTHSWDWFSKWGGKREVTFRQLGESWRQNKTILTIAIDENLNIERHYCGNSLNIAEHTIQSLLDTTRKSIEEYESALKLQGTVKKRIEDYEEALRLQVDNLYQLYIKEVDALVYSQSI